MPGPSNTPDLPACSRAACPPARPPPLLPGYSRCTHGSGGGPVAVVHAPRGSQVSCWLSVGSAVPVPPLAARSSVSTVQSSPPPRLPSRCTPHLLHRGVLLQCPLFAAGLVHSPIPPCQSVSLQKQQQQPRKTHFTGTNSWSSGLRAFRVVTRCTLLRRHLGLLFRPASLSACPLLLFSLGPPAAAHRCRRPSLHSYPQRCLCQHNTTRARSTLDSVLPPAVISSCLWSCCAAL